MAKRKVGGSFPHFDKLVEGKIKRRNRKVREEKTKEKRKRKEKRKEKMRWEKT